jgi:hypothetical protein
MQENNLDNDTLDANTNDDGKSEGIQVVEGSNGGGDDENDGMDLDSNGQLSDALYRFEVSNALLPTHHNALTSRTP